MRIFYALCFVGVLGLPLTVHAQEHHHPPQDVQLHEKFTALGTCLISPRKAVAASRIATRQRSNTSERRCSLGHGKTESGSSFRRRRSSVTATIQTAAITSACRPPRAKPSFLEAKLAACYKLRRGAPLPSNLGSGSSSARSATAISISVASLVHCRAKSQNVVLIIVLVVSAATSTQYAA